MSGYNRVVTMAKTFPVRFGTSGFSAGGWVGTFYPEKTKPKDYLGLYSQVLDTVEIDSTFYGTPATKTVENWYKRTPDGFVFAAKVAESITHDKCLKNCDEEFGEFISTMGNLKEKLGPLLFQFPYFSGSSGIDEGEFVERVESFLPKLPREMQFAMEIRNKAWIGTRLLDTLHKHNVALALIDHPKMPRPKRMVDADAITADFVYSRLLGDRYAIEELTTSWDKTVVDKSSEIDEWVEVTNVLRKRVPVYTFVNNHFDGHAPATVAELKKRIYGTVPQKIKPVVESSGQMSLL